MALHPAASGYRDCSAGLGTRPETIAGLPIHGRVLALLSVHPAWSLGLRVDGKIVSQLKCGL